MGAFGATIPVTTLNNGFLGAVTRLGKRGVTARQVCTTTQYASATGPNFGDPCVIVATSGGGDTLWSVKDYIGNGGTFTAALFAGVAVREVKTNLSFTSYETIGGAQIGNYAPGSMGEILEEGSCAVKVNVTTGIASQGVVYVRVSANGANTIVGGFEAASDTTHTVALTGVVWRTGVVDANGVAEITILNRVAA